MLLTGSLQSTNVITKCPVVTAAPKPCAPSKFNLLTAANMLILDSTMLFFYSRIVSNNDQEPPSKKIKVYRESISTWVNNVRPNAPPPPSRVASSQTGTSSKRPPPLTVGSTYSSANSVLTNTIRITQNTQWANVKREPHIQVEDHGIFSDYDETISQEQDRALTSPLKNGVRATSSVHYIFILFFN